MLTRCLIKTQLLEPRTLACINSGQNPRQYWFLTKMESVDVKQKIAKLFYRVITATTIAPNTYQQFSVRILM